MATGQEVQPWEACQSVPEAETSAAAAPTRQRGSSVVTTKGACGICGDVEGTVTSRPCCGLAACEVCLAAHVVSKVSEGAVKVRCPRCVNLLSDADVERLLPSVQLQRRWRQSVVDTSHDPSLKTCPGCGLAKRLPGEDLGSQQSQPQRSAPSSSSRRDPSASPARLLPLPVTCGECALTWCFSCHAPWHEGLGCREREGRAESQFQEWVRGGEADDTDVTDGPGRGEQSEQTTSARSCPQCKVMIQRISGCPQMTCCVCLAHFCYECGEQLAATLDCCEHNCRVQIRTHPGRSGLRADGTRQTLGADLKWLLEALSTTASDVT